MYPDHYKTYSIQAMRVIKKIGNIYEVKLGDGEYAYFQYLGEDSSQLYGDVIRVFESRYLQRPSIETIVSDGVEFYIHTFLRFGVKTGFWEKIGYSDEIGRLDIEFKVDRSYCLASEEDKNSDCYWKVWVFNKPCRFAGKLPKKYHSANEGSVYPPSLVVEQIAVRKLID